MVIYGLAVANGKASGDKKEWVHDPLLSFVRSRSGGRLKRLDPPMQAETAESQSICPSRVDMGFLVNRNGNERIWIFVFFPLALKRRNDSLDRV